MSRFSVFVILLLSVTVEVIECRKTFGGGGIRFPAPSRHSPSHSTHNTGSGRRPIGFDHYNPPHQAASGFHPPSRPSAPIEPPKYNAPVASAPHGPGTVRPIGFDTSGHHSSGSPHLGQPVGPPKQNTPTGQNPPPYNPAGYGSPPAYNPAGYGNPPAYTQGNLGQGGYHNPGGYNPQGGYHPPGGYQPGYHPQGGGGGYTVINNNINNHHYNGYSGGYGGYSPPVYTSHDTGSTALGFFLGYSLAKVTTPSFLGQNSYNNGPRYDHYTVHHYYHNKENVPSEATIQPNAIVACIGDSGSFCPSNTTSLCTNNRAVMCVASATSTVPCSNQQQTNCVKSSIPCKNNSAPECKESNQDKATIAIPCISTAKVYGHLSYVNNSIVVSNATMNSTSPLAVNSTTNLNVSTTTGTTDMVTNSSATDVSITTTESNLVNATATNNSTNIKEESQMFCVTILALPAERKLTQGEKFINHSKGIFSKFAVKVLGID